ncbi:MAG: tetratricopeptide repeat protein [Burkholderiales bacterium]|nr:tetratricopeptide repeat protein [Burkholderiales bacterium]
MKSGSTPLPALARLLVLVLAASLSAGLALADDYSDISQMLRAGRLAEARTRVDRALAAKPRDPQMRYFKGVIQRDSGQQAEALTTFTKLTEDYPELPEPHNALAVIHAAQGDLDKARRALEMAIRVNPAYATAHENLGDVYARLAVQAYCKALQLDANNSALRSKLSTLGTHCP